MASNLTYKSGEQSVQSLIDHYRGGRLNLEPGFQRQSVWKDRDRQFLIDSIIRGYPLPTVFLYSRLSEGEPKYDVIDGKQRVETLLMFCGEMRGRRRFEAKVQLPGEDSAAFINWRKLEKLKKQHLITAYRIQCIEVEGDLSDIIHVFVRINSTGKALTRAERRNARFHESAFLKKAGQLAERYVDYFHRSGIISASQRSRMKHIELVCELMLSAHQGDVINKKAALDKVMESQSLPDRAVAVAAKTTARTLNRLARILPNIKATRFRQISDFYTLAVLFMQFEKEGKILTNARRNSLASQLLKEFSTGVDGLREKQKRLEGIKPNEELFRGYLTTVVEGTDAQPNRQRRAAILRGLLESLFEEKDAKRGFSKEQRRILWNTTNIRKCSCGADLTWNDFTIDHIKPHSKGGRTKLDNAALLCRRCNSSKGNRRAG